jgi:heme-degrading monooxygenase HmoA
MFVVLYRWRIKAGFEEQFKDGWSEVTKYYLKNFDSLGSRLHHGDDGLYYAYAQWKSAEQRERAFLDSALNSASEKMRRAIEETFPEVELEVIADFLKKIK